MKDVLRIIRDRIKSELAKIRADKDMMSKIYLISLGTALIILAIAVKGPEQKGRIVTDNKGRATEIDRYSMDSSETYDFEVEISEGRNTIVKEVNLTIQAVRKESDSSLLDTNMSREEELEAALESAISDIQYSKNKKISLPAELSDGSKISWTPLIRKDYSTFLLVPLIYICLLVFVIRSSGEKEGAAEAARRQSIVRGLPRFCNQLFLMMNAGMILSDAFEKITAAYKSRSDEDASDEKESGLKYFERELVAMNRKNKDKRDSTAAILNEFAVKNDVKEMIRIATILNENEKRGSDVIESLSRESRYLWDERKIVARESGKMIDTKMSYPLGILLILLIVITMAPAMLSM